MSAAGVDLTAQTRGLAYDSRRVKPGDVFFGLAGLKHDGRAFVRGALDAGAVAAVVERDLEIPGAPLVHVDEPRRALAVAAAALNRHPSRRLTVVGVTGTNGKTTTTYLVESIFRAAGIESGRIGTTGIRLGAEQRAAAFTTPEAPELQGLLAEMVARGIAGVALELSSHALAQRRCFDLACDAAVFTNLTHDHLDYHGTLERYLDAKLMLFDGRNQTRAVKRTVAIVNLDDPHAARVIDAAEHGGLAIRTYGESAGADVAIRAIAPAPDGLRFTLAEPAGNAEVQLPLWGRYNAWNAAAAFAAARSLGIAADVALAGLARVEAVPGRLERVALGQRFEVVVDYAHTPDALDRTLRATREHARGRVLLVFGCGGDRDRAKRPVMGRIASELSDLAWVTNDNPRSEDSASIAREILSGAPEAKVDVELDRRAAIARAIGAARDGDAVLIAGKGHETTQTIGDRVLEFDDRAVARECLRARLGESR